MKHVLPKKFRLKSATLSQNSGLKSHWSRWKPWPLTQILWFHSLCIQRMPKCRANHKPVYCVMLPGASIDFSIHSAWMEGTERLLMRICLILDSIWLSAVQVVHTQFWVNCNLQSAHLKSASQWHMFSWPVSHVPQECHFDLTKLTLGYHRTDSGEADLK